jgi:hypothetical protein
MRKKAIFVKIKPLIGKMDVYFQSNEGFISC